MPIPEYDVVIVVPSQQDGRYVLQTAYGNRLYWFSIAADEFSENPIYEEFKARAYLELQNMLEVVEPGTYTYATLTVDEQGQILAIADGQVAGPVEPPVGTVMYAPVPPDETWLECNGQAVSRASYAALYAEIGQKYLTYKLTRAVTADATLSTSNTNFFIFTGTAWLMFGTNSAVKKSTDGGLTWAAVTAMPGAIATNNKAVAGNGAVLFYGSGQTTAYRTDNDGTSWTTITLPATGISSIGVHTNGTTWVAVQGNGGLGTYYTLDAGATWATAGNTASGGQSSARVFWDGTNWVYLTYPGAAVGGIGRQTKATHDAAWSALTYPTNPMMLGYTGSAPANVPGTGIMARGAVSDPPQCFQYSTDSGVSHTTFGLAKNNVDGPIWNGLHFLFQPSANAPLLVTMPLDGSVVYENVMNFGSGTGDGRSFGLYFVNAPAGFNTVVNGRADMVNHRVVCKVTQIVDAATTAAWYPAVIEPSITLATHFNVPNYVNAPTNHFTGKAWIKA